jgi:hypothetical protein
MVNNMRSLLFFASPYVKQVLCRAFCREFPAFIPAIYFKIRFSIKVIAVIFHFDSFGFSFVRAAQKPRLSALTVWLGSCFIHWGEINKRSETKETYRDAGNFENRRRLSGGR